MITDYNYYDLLGIPHFSDIETIKKSYRKIASQHHPDKIGPNEYFSKVTAAYNILGDHTTKQKYDSEIKIKNFAKITHNQEMLSAMCVISVRDLYSDEWKILNLNTEIGNFAINVKLDGGLETGARVKYNNVGPQGQTVLIIYKILPDSVFSKRGLDLYCKLEVDVLQLLCGCAKTVATPDNSEWTIKIPPVVGKPKTLKLNGLGFKTKNKTGDFYVEIDPLFSEISPELNKHIRDEITMRGKEEWMPIQKLKK